MHTKEKKKRIDLVSGVDFSPLLATLKVLDVKITVDLHRDAIV